MVMRRRHAIGNGQAFIALWRQDITIDIGEPAIPHLTFLKKLVNNKTSRGVRPDGTDLQNKCQVAGDESPLPSQPKSQDFFHLLLFQHLMGGKFVGEGGDGVPVAIFAKTLIDVASRLL